MVTEAKSVLAQEVEVYERLKLELLASDAGKFVVIHEDDVLGVFDSGEIAYEAGLRAYGNVPMLVREILEEQPVYCLFFVGFMLSF